jgi:hypothetical protein
MVTTTMGMLYWVHGNTTHLRPAVALDLVLVVGATCLQNGLVDTTTPRDNTFKKKKINKKDCPTFKTSF